MPAPALTGEVQYLLLVVGLFIVPRLLQRLRIPSAVTCVALGGALGMGFHLFHDDTAIPLLSTLGIVSLFLFAGLEVDLDELRERGAITLWHLLLQVILLAAGAWLASKIFSLEWRPALLLALAILTPSTGFILDSLPSFGLSEHQRSWVKTKAIASELVALGVLFVVVQSGSIVVLLVSTAVLAAMVALLPWTFRIFARRILPFAPKSEFAFLLILALICAYVTRHLGVYYLVGAFVVGVTAVRMSKTLPALASQRLLIGIELFASFFIPFYFFKAGLHLERDYFSWRSAALGAALVVGIVPLRIASVAVFRKLLLGETVRDGARVGLSLVPTLVFTLVIADILNERFGLSNDLFGALLVFTLLNTAVPGLLLRTAAPEFVAPEVPRTLSNAPPAKR